MKNYPGCIGARRLPRPYMFGVAERGACTLFSWNNYFEKLYVDVLIDETNILRGETSNFEIRI